MSGDAGKEKPPPGGYDATPIPHAPPGYTVKITMRRATHLPLADFSTLSSDPYMQVEVKTALEPRHKEDPILTFRTHTIWKTTEPVWNREWTIANIPASGFKLKARLYDEDASDQDDRLGNVHVTIGPIDEKWQGIHDQAYKIKRRSGSWRAYAIRGLAVCMGKAKEMSGYVYLSFDVLGKTPGEEGGRAYTIGKNYWCKHSAPFLGRIAGSKEPGHDQDPEKKPQSVSHSPTSNTGTNEKTPAADNQLQTPQTPSAQATGRPSSTVSNKKQSQHYNFQANQFQLRGPVPAELYHRYVEFRPFVKSMFTATGVRGILLSKALHHQHMQVYNFNQHTEYGSFDSPNYDMTMKFLELCHFDRGGKIHTYVLTLDGLMRFTETGKDIGIDLLSKHTMHSDRSIYIAFSGEFFIRRLKNRSHAAPSNEDTSQEQLKPEPRSPRSPGRAPGSSSSTETPKDPAYYELIIDNDSGTYRPNAKQLPNLRMFLEANFPGLKVLTLDCQKDADLMKKLKDQQRENKKKSGQVVFTQVSRASSSSSSDKERLEQREQEEDVEYRQKHRLGEAVAPLVGDHKHVREMLGEERVPSPAPESTQQTAEASK